MKDTPFTANRLLALYDQVAGAEDAIPRLRRFVLDLAVRGKLVAQDASDEPAAELLKRIAKEKAQLVKAGEIKEAKPFAMADVTLMPVPQGWQVVPLGEVINRHVGGGTPSKNDHSYWGGDIRWASVKDVGKAKYVDDTIDRITQKGLESSSSNLVPAGNLIVVTRMGLGQLSINRVPVAINQDLRALFLSPFVDIDFVYNFFLTYGMEGTGLTVKGIKIEELLGIPFPLPPLAEQRRIVGRVEELMALCDQLQAARAGETAVRDRLTTATLSRLTAPDQPPEAAPQNARFALQSLPTLTNHPAQIKTLRQTILNLAVRGKLVAQDPTDEPAAELLIKIEKEKACLTGKKRAPASPLAESAAQPFELPQGWAWSPPEDISLKITDGEHFRPPTVPNGVYFLSAKDVRDEGVSLANPLYVSKEIATKARARCDPEFGDILIVSRGATCGRICRVNIHDEFCLLGSVILIKPSSFVVSSYLEFALRSPSSLAALVSASGATAQGAIYLRDLKKIAIPLPPLAEQHRIVVRVDALMALCDQLEASLTTATTTRSRLLEALLHEALGGQSEAA